MKEVVNTCWFVFKWGALAALMAGVALGLYFYSRVNDEIRKQVQAKLQGHYKNLVVTVRSAQLVDGEGIEVRGLTLVDPNATGPQAELAYFDELILFCQTSLPELMKGEPKITHGLIRRPTLHSTRRPDGTWSAMHLLPIPKFGPKPLPVTIENGTFEFFDPLKNPTSTVTLRDINMQTEVTPAERPGEWNTELRGYLGGDHFQRIEFAGKIGPDFKGMSFEGTLSGLDFSPEFRDSLPADLTNRLAVLAPMRGQARIEFRGHDNPGGAVPVIFQVKGQLSSGRFDDPRLPYPLTDMKVDFRADNQGLVVEDLTARAGQASLHAAGEIQGYRAGAPLRIRAHTEHLLIGRQWESVLPEKLLDEWRKFLPAGEINADLALSFDGKSWRPDLTVQCLNVSGTFFKFPYRLDRGSGTLRLVDGHATIDMTAYAAGQRVAITGRFENPGEHYTGDLDVRGDNVPFDENLFSAIQEKPREVIRALNPSGTFNFVMKSHREDTSRPPVLSLWLNLNRASVRYDKFPYPINNIVGTVVMVDNHWTFRELEGTNGPGHIHCQGFLNPVADGTELSLQFNATSVPLQEDLRDSLPPSAQRVWNQLKPQGAIHLTSDVHFLSAEKKPDVRFRAEPVDETTSIAPVFFPYRLEKLRGAMSYREGHIDLENIRAVHDRTPLEASGFCNFDGAGNWNLKFERFVVDRLRADRDLMAALSGRIKKNVTDLNPMGAMNISGSVEFAAAADTTKPVQTKWNVNVVTNQASVGQSVRLENLNGNIRLIGDWDGEKVRCGGQASIDSVTFKDFQFTQVKGPLYFDNRQVIFGAGAPRPANGPPPPHVTASLYGGGAQLDCALVLGDKSTFSLQALLTDGDLKRFAHEFAPGKQKLDGKVLASINLGGDTSGVHSLLGRGEIRLSQADIYELPFMVSLLKLLSVKTPDSTAFTNSTIKYRIEGDHMYLDNVAFNGDAISLEGSGQMGFDLGIDLKFHSLVGRSDWQLPVLKNVMGAASRQLMQISVTGSLSDPKMTRTVLPAVSKALEYRAAPR